MDLDRIGEEDYINRGFLLGGVSLVLSLGSLWFLPYGLFWQIGLNVGLFVVLTLINMRGGGVPGSSHGL